MSTTDSPDRRSRSPEPYYKSRSSKDENSYWERRREKRSDLAARGCKRVWGTSPTRDELQRIYSEYEEAQRKALEEEKDAERAQKKRLKEEKKRKRKRSSSVSSSDSEKAKKKKHKKKSHKKEKKAKKHKKKHRRSSSESVSSDIEETGTKEEEWVEMTREIRQEVEQKQKAEDAEIIGPSIPEHLVKAKEVQFVDVASIDRTNMPRGEAVAMAAYAAQGKRIPRRGEIGLSSDEIATFEQVGYVMSGTRHKSMEATRLRKENQIMTAEEKRLLSGFTHEQRHEKEETVMKQFKSLINSKRSQMQ